MVDVEGLTEDVDSIYKTIKSVFIGMLIIEIIILGRIAYSIYAYEAINIITVVCLFIFSFMTFRTWYCFRNHKKLKALIRGYVNTYDDFKLKEYIKIVIMVNFILPKYKKHITTTEDM